MNRFLILVYISCIFTSCFRNRTETSEVYYSDYNVGELYYAGNKIFSVKEKQILEKQDYTMAVKYFYDLSTNTIWGCSSNRKTNTILLFNKFEDDFIKTSLTISFDKSPFICGISNNTLLNCISSSNKQYELVSLPDLRKKKFEIITDKLILLPIGFFDNRIFFDDGFYDIDRNEYIQYEINLKYKRVIDSETIVGIDEFSEIVIYNIKIKNVVRTGILRVMYPYARYSSDNLYYLKNDILYYSEDYCILSFIRKFLPIWYTKTRWKMKKITSDKQDILPGIGPQCYIIGSK